MRRSPVDERISHRQLAVVGAAIFFIVLTSALEPKAEASFAAHMVQHMLIVVLCAPLFVLAWRPGWSLPMPVSWLLFAAVMWGTHLTSFYDAALDNATLHALEHFVFLGVSIAFWMPVMSGDRPYPLRLAYLALTLPQQAFLALAIYSATTPLYEHYPDLDDQKAGAIVMWVGGDLALIVAIALVIGAWMRAESVENQEGLSDGG